MGTLKDTHQGRDEDRQPGHDQEGTAAGQDDAQPPLARPTGEAI
jgi:hypothetical protein